MKQFQQHLDQARQEQGGEGVHGAIEQGGAKKTRAHSLHLHGDGRRSHHAGDLALHSALPAPSSRVAIRKMRHPLLLLLLTLAGINLTPVPGMQHPSLLLLLVLPPFRGRGIRK